MPGSEDSAGPAVVAVAGSEDSAGPAAVARGARGFHELAAENRWLRDRSARRHLLDLAAGVLAAQLRLPPSEAAEYLSALAQATGLSAEDLAADIVNGAADGSGPAVTVPSESEGPQPGRAAPAHPGEARRARRTAAAAEAADTVGEASRTLLDEGLAPLGADSLWLWRRVDRDCLRLVGCAGAGAAEAAAWQWIPPAAPETFRTVLAGTPVWLEDGSPPDEMLPGPTARALLPLRRRDRTVGVALVGWPGPTPLDTTARRALTGLMEVAGTVLDTAGSPPAAFPVLVDVLDSLAQPAMLLSVPGTSGQPVVEHLNDEGAGALGGTSSGSDASLARAFPSSTPTWRAWRAAPPAPPAPSGPPGFRRPPDPGTRRRSSTCACSRPAEATPSCCGTRSAPPASPRPGRSPGCRASPPSRTA
ncbi:GAF and ANTAR domain-containing protein [Streptomyces sp. NPDC012756]|uniref:GAF and ANTAR domain-containing protein n=1 Tax=Streptomyces sp. NPDC012756 TaxID=3364847 RepID=UPI00367BD61B